MYKLATGIMQNNLDTCMRSVSKINSKCTLDTKGYFKLLPTCSLPDSYRQIRCPVISYPGVPNHQVIWYTGYQVIGVPNHRYTAVTSELDPHRDWTHGSISDDRIGPGVHFRWTVLNRTLKVGLPSKSGV